MDPVGPDLLAPGVPVVRPRGPDDLERDHRLHAGACLALAGRLLRDSHLAEDVVQEAFAEMWAHPARRDGSRATTRSWLLMLTHRRAVDRIRREQLRRCDSLTSAHDRPDAGPDTPLLALSHLLGAELVPLLAGLSEVQREAVVLIYWGGLTHLEVAGVTGAPLGTVKTRVRTGLARLRVGMQA